MRIYLPATMSSLAEAVATGEHGPVPLTGFAVTPALREWYIEDDADDIEELEYAAFTEATRGALRLLDSDPLAARRRVVISADVADDLVTARPELDRAVVRVGKPVPIQWWACVHVDGAEAQDTVRSAAAAVIPADLGDADAQFTVDAALGHELEWYGVSELDILLK